MLFKSIIIHNFCRLKKGLSRNEKSSALFIIIPTIIFSLNNIMIFKLL